MVVVVITGEAVVVVVVVSEDTVKPAVTIVDRGPTLGNKIG